MKSDAIYPTLKPTWARLLSLFVGKGYRSVTRALQYEKLKQISFEGRLLDVGGGESVPYRDILGCQSYESVNINPEMKPSFLVKVGDDLTQLNELFDNVLSLNTFEHVLDAEKLLVSISNTLRPGGKFYASTPFLYPVHGSPDDFFRPTHSWWFQVLVRNNFVKIKITPLLWGPFSTGALCSGLPGPFKRYRMITSLALDILYAKIKFRNSSCITDRNGQFVQNFALGYFIEAEKSI